MEVGGDSLPIMRPRGFVFRRTRMVRHIGCMVQRALKGGFGRPRVLVKATISELEGTAKDKLQGKLPVGTEFSFRWKVQDGTATLDDVKGDTVGLLKSHLVGDYEPKK